MQIVIDIFEDDYISLKDTVDYAKNYDNAIDNVIVAIANGIVLPKEHGRLCDLDALWDKLNRLKKERVISEREFDDFATLLGLSPIVLKADKEAVDAGNSN